MKGRKEKRLLNRQPSEIKLLNRKAKESTDPYPSDGRRSSSYCLYTNRRKSPHWIQEDELFRNFPIDEEVNPVCLECLGNSSVRRVKVCRFKTFPEKMMGNLADDHKMVKNELLTSTRGDNNFKEERQSLLLPLKRIRMLTT
ncbi:hypothetical protein AVEN_163710-1 [Araneus ventricosus]|uniref:Uncharacterized protein n=1 Tax=Araneus ventricosus TaxID=182803 RepID=A0A4Y2I0B8_ARAVE|nr:hypothetical protein AVEN_163710-1 [Araneus ventricosus]